MLRLLIIIGSGSFIGGILRFVVARFVQSHASAAFPLGTLIVNVAGCFLIGIFYGLSERGNLMNAELRMFLTVGFCGGFTTFSTFANENIILLREGDFFYFALYTALSVFLGLLATFAGNLIIKAV